MLAILTCFCIVSITMAQQVDHHLKGVNWILDQTLLDQILSIMNNHLISSIFLSQTHTPIFKLTISSCAFFVSYVVHARQQIADLSAALLDQHGLIFKFSYLVFTL